MGFPKKVRIINIIVVNGLSLNDRPNKFIKTDNEFLDCLANILQNELKTSGNIKCSINAENKIIFNNVPLAVYDYPISFKKEHELKDEDLDLVLKNFVKRISDDLNKIITVEFRCQALKYNKTIIGAPLELIKKVEGFGK